MSFYPITKIKLLKLNLVASKKYYYTTIVDSRSTNPGRLLRQFNIENVKYQKANNRYVMPVDVQILMVNPKNRSSVKELIKHLSVSAISKKLHMSRNTVNRILNKK